MEKTGISQSVRKIESWSSKDLAWGQGRSKITWRMGLEKVMKGLNLQIEMVEIRNKWRRGTHESSHLKIVYMFM